MALELNCNAASRGVTWSRSRPDAQDTTRGCRDPCSQRGFDQLVEGVVGGVTDEARVEHERVAFRFRETTNPAQGSDLVPARF